MAKTRIYFATDLHGSSVCFRKFINSAKVYQPDVLILGGDFAGKAIQSIIRGPKGHFYCEFAGAKYDVEDGPDLVALEKLIADHGYYPCRAEPGELEQLDETDGLDRLFDKLMRERVTEWLDLADQRLRPLQVPFYFMLGNDDPEELNPMLEAAPWGTQAEGKVVWLDDEHEMISWGYSNITPWHTYREQSEETLAAAFEGMAEKVTRPERAVFNLHVPPFGTQLDEAPVLDEKLQVQAVLGQVQYAPVGSPAVREIEERRQPLLGLHGHIHESSGIRRLGRTMAINPGSDYATGALDGVLVTLDRDKVSGHQLVRG